ncbi:tetratricopeptide repeat protein [Streptomyces tanashiensis]|uniref:tetratricopeptide repeat protein n=1 Tax=Streptomyces tanashiensis TaxID=67367 RepID=UPI00340D2A04
MDPELAVLAGTAGTTLVTLLTTEAWQRVSDGITSLWRRAEPARAEAISAELDVTRTDLLAARDGGDLQVGSELGAEWQGRIRRLLVTHPEEAAALLATGPAVIADCISATGEDHPMTLGAELNYAFTLSAMGRPAEALPHARRALTGYERLFTPDYPLLLNARQNLSVALHALGRHAEAIEQGEILVDGRIRVLGPAHPWTVHAEELLHEYRNAARSS